MDWWFGIAMVDFGVAIAWFEWWAQRRMMKGEEGNRDRIF